MRLLRFISLAGFVVYSVMTFAGELGIPQQVPAGKPLTVNTGAGGTLYLFGPAGTLKQKVSGGTVEIPAEQLQAAGRYTVMIGNDKSSFYVVNDTVDSVAFLARPSRVPASAPGAITGSAFLFDRYNNLVLQPTAVRFELSVAGGSTATRSETAKNGVAWVRLDSGRQQGAAQFVASAENAATKRVVQQVAAEPCNVRMRATHGKTGSIEVETDPIRDCSGNAVPDGTIVTFTSIDSKGRSTVDARIKRGVAKAELPASNNAQLSVAAGVVMGNEIRWGGK